MDATDNLIEALVTAREHLLTPTECHALVDDVFAAWIEQAAPTGFEKFEIVLADADAQDGGTRLADARAARRAAPIEDTERYATR